MHLASRQRQRHVKWLSAAKKRPRQYTARSGKCIHWIFIKAAKHMVTIASNKWYVTSIFLLKNLKLYFTWTFPMCLNIACCHVERYLETDRQTDRQCGEEWQYMDSTLETFSSTAAAYLRLSTNVTLSICAHSSLLTISLNLYALQFTAHELIVLLWNQRSAQLPERCYISVTMPVAVFTVAKKVKSV